jgi:RNA polymerase sigma-70 factor (ECF subfamily)
VVSPTANSLLSFRIAEAKAVEDFSAERTVNAIAELTRRLAAGEEEAFREFHALYFDRLYRFLLVVSRGHEPEAQDALQQTLLRVVRYARVFESDAVFWSWLKALARSAARDGGRKEQRYLALLHKFTLRGHFDSEENSAEDGRLRAVLEETLAELHPQERRLLEDKYLDGTSVKELSVEAGMTEKALESRLLRLRRQVRESILKKLKSL